MEKLDIIKKVKKPLDTKYKTATITFKNVEKPFYSFLETDFLDFVKEGASPENLVNYIKTGLNKYIKFNNPKLNAVNIFIDSCPTFKDIIQTGEDTVISAREYLYDFCLKNMDDAGYINYAGKQITIEDLYIKLLNNEYRPATLEEKQELCVDMCRYIEQDILDSIVDGMSITVRDYITNVVPNKMVDATNILVNDAKVPIYDFVIDIVNHQATILEQAKQQEKEAKENEFNKTADNPGLVSEIQVKLKENNDFEITAEIPVVASSLINDDEKISLINNYRQKEQMTEEEFYMMELNHIKYAIDNVNTAHNLDSLEKFYNKVKEEAVNKNLSTQIQILIASIEELITNKRNNIIKVVNNQEEYTDVLFSEINSMKDELETFTTLDEYGTLYGKAIDRYQEVLNKGIKDLQLQSAFHVLFNRISEKRLNLDATIGYQSPEVERVKVELNALMTSIKQDILTIEHDSNNLGNFTGTEVRLNLNIGTAKEQVEKAYIDGFLTEDDKEYYMNRLKGYAMAIQSETKIGYGLR